MDQKKHVLSYLRPVFVELQILKIILLVVAISKVRIWSSSTFSYFYSVW